MTVSDKGSLNLNDLLLTLTLTVQLLNSPKQKRPFFFSKFEFSLNVGDLVFWLVFNLAVNVKCQMSNVVYSGHALSYTKLVHRHATQTEGNKYFK